MLYADGLYTTRNATVTYLETKDKKTTLKVSDYVLAVFPDFHGSINWAFVVTWYKVRFDYSSADISPEYTFQVVLASDDNNSFVIIQYNAIPLPCCNPVILRECETHTVISPNLAGSNIESEGKWIFQVDSDLIVAPNRSRRIYDKKDIQHQPTGSTGTTGKTALIIVYVMVVYRII